MQFVYMLFVLILETGLRTIVAHKAVQRVRVKADTGIGVSAYIAVEKQAVQDILDDFNNREVNGKRGPQLYLPTKPVFEDMLTNDHHVVYFDIGVYDFFETHGAPSLSSKVSEAAIFIPFLASHPDGVPKYSLDMAQFYDKDRRGEAGGEVIFPYYGLDEVTFTETDAVLRNGSEELRISLVISNPCKAPPSIRRHEFDVFIEEEFIFSFSKKLDLGWCDHLSLAEDQSCTKLKSIKPNLEKAFPNVCEFASSGLNVEICEASFAITSITQGFRDLLLLNNDPINVVASESIEGDYYAYLKYPCIE